MHTYLPAEREIFLKFSQVKGSLRETLLIFNMIKVEVNVGAGGRGKLRKRWVRVEAMVLEKAQRRSDTWRIWEICTRSSALARSKTSCLM